MMFRHKDQWLMLREIVTRVPESSLLYALQEMVKRGDNLAYFGDYLGLFLFTGRKTVP